MAQFMTRVMLNGNPTAEQYEKLHKVMKNKGFSRVISDDDGNYYWLPHAEYYREGNLSTKQVLDDAKAAANSVKTPNEVLVTEAKSIRWNGLQPATAADAKVA